MEASLRSHLTFQERIPGQRRTVFVPHSNELQGNQQGASQKFDLGKFSADALGELRLTALCLRQCSSSVREQVGVLLMAKQMLHRLNLCSFNLPISALASLHLGITMPERLVG